MQGFKDLSSSFFKYCKANPSSKLKNILTQFKIDIDTTKTEKYLINFSSDKIF